MIRLTRGVRAAMLVRSLAVQGSWNYRSLVGPGFAFALLPALRAIHSDEPGRVRDAERRHSTLFNCHPYLAPMALGAVAAMEAAGEDPAMIARFKAAIRGSLGTLGDRIVWAGWRPACLLVAIALLLLGAPWWLGMLVFLALYNAGHVALRVWSLHLGLTEGRRVAERLRRAPVTEVQRMLASAGAFLVGLVLPLAASGAVVGVRLALPWIAAAALAAALGVWFGARVRPAAVAAVIGTTLVGILFGGWR